MFKARPSENLLDRTSQIHLPGIQRQAELYDRWVDIHEPSSICSCVRAPGAQQCAAEHAVRHRGGSQSESSLTESNIWLTDCQSHMGEELAAVFESILEDLG